MIKDTCQLIVVSICEGSRMLGKMTWNLGGMTWQHGGINKIYKI